MQGAGPKFGETEDKVKIFILIILVLDCRQHLVISIRIRILDYRHDLRNYTQNLAYAIRRSIKLGADCVF